MNATPQPEECELVGCHAPATSPVRRKAEPRMRIWLCAKHAEPYAEGRNRHWEIAPDTLFEVGT